MANTYEEKVKNEWEKFSIRKKEFFPNIMLLGETGCGKSSLINLIFGKEIASVNDVSRGTEHFDTYFGKNYGVGVNLIDSRGYEMEDGKGESFSSYFRSIKEKMANSCKKNPMEKIHIIWFCISVAGERIQPYDIEILKLLQKEQGLGTRNRVSVILTKCDQDDEDGGTAKIFKRIIAEEIGAGIRVFEVSTDPSLKLDLEKLIDWSAEQLDDKDLKEAFVSSQVVNLKKKQETALARIGMYTASAAAICATPFPMSDAALLVPLQITMSTHIIRIYGMENFANISSAVIGDVVISNLGKAFAGGLLKLIPGIGTLIGDIINAGVASLITSALGFAISEICFTSCKKIAEGEYVDMSNIFDGDMIQSYTREFMKNNKRRGK